MQRDRTIEDTGQSINLKECWSWATSPAQLRRDAGEASETATFRSQAQLKAIVTYLILMSLLLLISFGGVFDPDMVVTTSVFTPQVVASGIAFALLRFTVYHLEASVIFVAGSVVSWCFTPQLIEWLNPAHFTGSDGYHVDVMIIPLVLTFYMLRGRWLYGFFAVEVVWALIVRFFIQPTLQPENLNDSTRLVLIYVCIAAICVAQSFMIAHYDDWVNSTLTESRLLLGATFEALVVCEGGFSLRNVVVSAAHTSQSMSDEGDEGEVVTVCDLDSVYITHSNSVFRELFGWNDTESQTNESGASVHASRLPLSRFVRNLQLLDHVTSSNSEEGSNKGDVEEGGLGTSLGNSGGLLHSGTTGLTSSGQFINEIAGRGGSIGDSNLVIFKGVGVCVDGTTFPVHVLHRKLPSASGVARSSIAIRDATEGERLKEIETEKIVGERIRSAQTAFLANVSHELRTPIHSQMLAVEALVCDHTLSKPSKACVDIIQNSSRVLHFLVNQVIDISSLEAKKVQLQRLSFSLSATMERLVMECHEIAKPSGVSVASYIPLPLYDYINIGDRDRLLQVLRNLVNNAVKFAEKGAVVISAELLSQTHTSLQVRFGVRDNGVGISPTKLAGIFDRFQQVDISNSRDHQGIGLGLSIASGLVRLLGGELQVESQLGAGAYFYFDAPIEIDTTARVRSPYKHLIPPPRKRPRVILAHPQHLVCETLEKVLTECEIADVTRTVHAGLDLEEVVSVTADPMNGVSAVFAIACSMSFVMKVLNYTAFEDVVLVVDDHLLTVARAARPPNARVYVVSLSAPALPLGLCDLCSSLTRSVFDGSVLDMEMSGEFARTQPMDMPPLEKATTSSPNVKTAVRNGSGISFDVEDALSRTYPLKLGSAPVLFSADPEENDMFDSDDSSEFSVDTSGFTSLNSGNESESESYSSTGNIKQLPQHSPATSIASPANSSPLPLKLGKRDLRRAVEWSTTDNGRIHLDTESEEVERERARVLLAEDNTVNRLMTSAILRSVGYTVLEAKNGLEAFNTFKADPGSIDIILMDIQMPVMDGIEATKRIRKLESKMGVLPDARVQIVGVTASTAAVADFPLIDGVVAKPFGRDELIEKVERSIKQEKSLSTTHDAF